MGIASLIQIYDKSFLDYAFKVIYAVALLLLLIVQALSNIL